MPVLTARHMCKGAYDQNLGEKNEKHCLAGWVRTIFREGKDWKQRDVLLDALELEIKEVAGFTNWIRIQNWNDRKDVSLAKLAKVWNGAIERLGYTEDA